jgi:hypothetical protein
MIEIMGRRHKAGDDDVVGMAQKIFHNLLDTPLLNYYLRYTYQHALPAPCSPLAPREIGADDI